MTPVIEVEDLWEAYPVRRTRAATLKALLSARDRKLRSMKWALKGVSFDVPAGQMLGIIGANGSGKSTLLRCLAGIFRPNRGRVTVRGRVASLIELMGGFQPDLPARDNVFLAGAIYGVPRARLEELLPTIFGFAELADHMDEPLSTFSAGMGLRLGFSVVVSLDPDILLVDEALAVGDEGFRNKCFARIGELHTQGTTIVCVSHELRTIRDICDRVLVLSDGKVAEDAPPERAIVRYCEMLGVDPETIERRGPSAASLVQRSWQRQTRR